MNSQGKSTLFLEGESQPQRDIILIRGNHFITRQYLSSKRPPGLIHMCGKIAVTILFEQTPLFYAKETYHRTLWLKIQPVQSHQESPRLDLHSILKGVPKFRYSPTILQTPVCFIKSLKSTLATGQWQRIMCDTVGVKKFFPPLNAELFAIITNITAPLSMNPSPITRHKQTHPALQRYCFCHIMKLFGQ